MSDNLCLGLFCFGITVIYLFFPELLTVLRLVCPKSGVNSSLTPCIRTDCNYINFVSLYYNIYFSNKYQKWKCSL